MKEQYENHEEGCKINMPEGVCTCGLLFRVLKRFDKNEMKYFKKDLFIHKQNLDILFERNYIAD